MSGFLDINQVLSMKDMNGEIPQFVFLLGGRTLGKTYGTSTHVVKSFIEEQVEFALISRFKKSLGHIANGMLGETIENNYPHLSVKEKVHANDYSEIRFVDSGSKEKSLAGYVLPINGAGDIKAVSQLFRNVKTMVFDEFTPTGGQRYAPNEVDNLINLFTSVSRGGGQAVRSDVRMIFISNKVDLLNEYFLALSATNDPDGPKLAQVLTPETKRFRGPGYVVFIYDDDSIAEQHKGSVIAKAFGGRGMDTLTGDTWEKHHTDGIGKPTKDWGGFESVCTIHYKEMQIGVRYYHDAGFLYLTRKVDGTKNITFKMTIDGVSNVPMIRHDPMGKLIRQYIQRGLIKYEDQELERIAFEFLV